MCLFPYLGSYIRLLETSARDTNMVRVIGTIDSSGTTTRSLSFYLEGRSDVLSQP